MWVDIWEKSEGARGWGGVKKSGSGLVGTRNREGRVHQKDIFIRKKNRVGI